MSSDAATTGGELAHVASSSAAAGAVAAATSASHSNGSPQQVAQPVPSSHHQQLQHQPPHTTPYAQHAFTQMQPLQQMDPAAWQRQQQMQQQQFQLQWQIQMAQHHNARMMQAHQFAVTQQQQQQLGHRPLMMPTGFAQPQMGAPSPQHLVTLPRIPVPPPVQSFSAATHPVGAHSVASMISALQSSHSAKPMAVTIARAVAESPLAANTVKIASQPQQHRGGSEESHMESAVRPPVNVGENERKRSDAQLPLAQSEEMKRSPAPLPLPTGSEAKTSEDMSTAPQQPALPKRFLGGEEATSAVVAVSAPGPQVAVAPQPAAAESSLPPQLLNVPPSELYSALQRMRAQNRQLERCYTNVRQRFQDVLELVEQSTSRDDREPPEVLLQIHTILQEAAARDAQLQTVGVEADMDPMSTGGAIAAAQPQTRIVGRSEVRGRERGPSRTQFAAPLLSAPSLHLSSPISGAAEVESAAMFLSHLAGAITSASPSQPAVTPSAAIALTETNRAAVLHQASRPRGDTPTHTYSTRPKNRLATFKFEPSPSPSESSEGEEAGAAGEQDVSTPRRKVKVEPAYEADAGTTSDEYMEEDAEAELSLDEPDELDELDDEDFAAHEPRKRIRNRSKAARATAATAASVSTASGLSPARSVGSSASLLARKRALAAEGRHAMTSISTHVSRYPLLTVFVKVAAAWTVEKNEAKAMTQEEQQELVLVPVRFMVLDREYRKNPDELSHDDIFVVAKDISVLIHKRKGSVAKSIYNFHQDEKMRIHVCSRPREAGRGSGVVGGGGSITGGGASVTGLSTQVLTILSWKGVQRLLHHSRSTLSSHVRRWTQAQYAAMITDAQLLKEHRMRAERMEKLKLLPPAQARAEETRLLRMEEEEEMDVSEGFEHLVTGTEEVSDEESLNDDTSVKLEGTSVADGASEGKANELSAAAAAATGDAPSPLALTSTGKRSHKRKPGSTSSPRRAPRTAAGGAKRIKRESPLSAIDTSQATAANEEPGSGGSAGTEQATGAAAETELVQHAVGSSSRVRVSQRSTKGKKPREAAAEAAAQQAEQAAAAQREQQRVAQRAAHDARVVAEPADSPIEVYEAQMVTSPDATATTRPFTALMGSGALYPPAPPGFFASLPMTQMGSFGAANAPTQMSALGGPLPSLAQPMPFSQPAAGDGGQVSVMPMRTQPYYPFAPSQATQPMQAQPQPQTTSSPAQPPMQPSDQQANAPVQLSLQVSSPAGSAAQPPPLTTPELSLDPHISTSTTTMSMSNPSHVSMLSPSNASAPLQVKQTGAGVSEEGATQSAGRIDVTHKHPHAYVSPPQSGGTSPLFEASSARRASIDSALGQPPSPHHQQHVQGQVPHIGTLPITDDAEAESRSLMHVTHGPVM